MFQKRRGKKGLNFAPDSKGIDFSIMNRIGAWIVELLIVVVIAVTLAYFVGMKIETVGQSMSPTLEAGDEVLVNRFIYILSKPKANDLVVFLPNGNEKSHYYIKRVIAVPGDTVQISNGEVYVNGEPFHEVVDVELIENAEMAAEEQVLESDEYFVLGDNRNNSEDSRYANIGNVKAEYIIGKAWFCVAPSSRIGKIQ